MYKINELRDSVTGALPFGKRLWIHMLNGLKTSVRPYSLWGLASKLRYSLGLTINAIESRVVRFCLPPVSMRIFPSSSGR